MLYFLRRKQNLALSIRHLYLRIPKSKREIFLWKKNTAVGVLSDSAINLDVHFFLQMRYPKNCYLVIWASPKIAPAYQLTFFSIDPRRNASVFIYCHHSFLRAIFCHFSRLISIMFDFYPLFTSDISIQNAFFYKYYIESWTLFVRNIHYEIRMYINALWLYTFIL